MKRIITGFLLLMSFNLYAQKTSQLPQATGTGKGALVNIVQNGANKKISSDSLIKPALNYADSLKTVLVAAVATKQPTLDNTNIKTINGTSVLGSGNIVITGGAPLDTTTIYLKLTQNAAAIGGKQPNLISGLNINTINGASLLGSSNIVITGASAKPLYKSIASSAGGIAIWNFDSSSTVVLTNEGTADLQITGSIPTGSTGILVFKQGAINIDLLKYNGSFLNIGRAPNKTSIVGFYKRDNDFVFSIDTTASIVAAAVTGGGTTAFDPSSQLLFDSALTNFSYKTAVDNAIKGLKSITLAAGGTAWSKSILINGRAGTSLAQQSYNWKAPGQFSYVYNGTFNYVAQGTQFVAAPTTGNFNYINTGLSPLTSFTGTITDVAVFNINGTQPNPLAATEGGIMLGSSQDAGTTNFYLYSKNTNDYSYALNAPVVSIATSPIGRFCVFYSDATTLKAYKNGVLLDSRTVTPQAAFNSFPLFEGALNQNGGLAFQSVGRTDVTQIINSKLTTTEAAAIDAVWAAYQTALNR